MADRDRDRDDDDTNAAALPETDERRARLIATAAAHFRRYGFKKTSMQEVAAAAGFSRQGLYFHFATKEDLLRATVQQLLVDALNAAGACLVVEAGADVDDIEASLVAAFDAWLGPFVDIVGDDGSDLAAVAKELVRPQLSTCSQLFVEAVAEHLRDVGVLAAYKPAGLNARQLADTLYATGRGLKQGHSREQFLGGMKLAVRAFCAPLRR